VNGISKFTTGGYGEISNNTSQCTRSGGILNYNKRMYFRAYYLKEVFI